MLSFSINVGETVKVTAELMHKDGYSKTTCIDLPRENSGSKNAVQAVGSSQIYGQRYTAQAILGLSMGDDTDDDGAGSAAPETVSPEQFIILRDLIEDTGTDEAKFHLAYGHKNPNQATLEMFPASYFDAAREQLQRKKDQANG